MQKKFNMYEYQKEKYECVRAFIPKEIGQKLKLKLKSENMSISKWISQNATKYLEV